MRIAIDAMGGDNAPDEIVKGGLQAARENPHIRIVFVGDENRIKKIIDEHGKGNEHYEIFHTTQVITNSDSPVASIKNKQDSSMVAGLKMIRKKEADVFVSAGNTGAFMVGALLLVGRIKGVDRPALGSVIPTRKKGMLLLDMGANMDSKPQHLHQFAIMGKVYSESILKVKQPRIGLLNVGQEETKGNTLTKEVYKILKDDPDLNFIGNVEARDVLKGDCDVLVCDGFSGNILLKSIEGFAINFFEIIKTQIKKSMTNKIGGFLLKPAFMEIKKKLDYTEYGGAPFLGINGICIKCHGSSNAKAVKNAVFQGEKFYTNKVLEKIKNHIEKGAI